MFGGDGFWTFEDTDNPDYIYAEAGLVYWTRKSLHA
jgi:hypothetical protein